MAQEGKVAVITGGGQGLGLGFATALGNSGYRVALLDINPTIGLDAAASLRERSITR